MTLRYCSISLRSYGCGSIFTPERLGEEWTINKYVFQLGQHDFIGTPVTTEVNKCLSAVLGGNFGVESRVAMETVKSLPL